MADNCGVEFRTERIVLETGKYRIVGDLSLPKEGYRSRLSDYLNQGDIGFIPLVDVEIAPLDGAGAVERRPFTAVARSHIQLAYPAAND